MRRRPLATFGVVLCCAASRSAVAQSPTPPAYTEYRADAIVGNGTAAQIGLGAVIPLGIYVRLGIDGAAGATWANATTRASGRVDAVARFLLDPFRETPVAVSVGGGLSLPYVDGQDRVRPFLTAVVDLEGRMRRRLTPALQIGLGGGTRIGFVLRSSPARWR